MCVHILKARRILRCSGPALRHKRDFNIATAQRPLEAMQVFIRIYKICTAEVKMHRILDAENA